MNLRIVSKYLSYLMWAEAGFLLVPMVVSLIYREGGTALAFVVTAVVCAVAASLLYFPFRKENSPLYVRESFVIAGTGWTMLSLFGALPFILSGEIPGFIDALFESVSGFSTTGASVVADVEALSKGIVFWRSFTLWLGGIGVLSFLVAILRAKVGSGGSLHLLRAEIPGPEFGKVLPKTKESIRMVFGIYLGLSGLNLLFLLLGGMPLFDALCTMFGTAGTGGFSFKNDSFSSFSPYLQTVCAVFMALFGVNFSLYFLVLRGQWRAVLKDEELHLYGGILAGAVVFITLSLVRAGFGSIGNSLHHAFFTVSSIITSSGFSTTDYNLWPEFSRATLLLLMIVGSMAGSTGGGFKVSRVLILLKSMKAGLHKMLHPRSVKVLHINGKPLSDKVVNGTYLFLAVYVMVFFVSFLLVASDGHTLETNLSAVLACLNNTGPGLGLVGPYDNFASYSGVSKLILAFDMMLGRLEIFPLLLSISPSTWRRKV